MATKDTLPFYKAYRWPVFLLACLLVLSAFLVKALFLDTDNSWSHGFSHPLEGWDHIVTMIAVGIWAAQLRGHAIWLLPLAFVGVMSLGGIAGAAGFLLPGVEAVILLSCAVFTLLIVRKIKFGSQTNLLLVSFFAFFHGFAHGQEISASASLLSYSIGFMLATLILHGAGILIAKLILLCLTCFFAMLLPNLAQAAQAKAMAKANGNLEPFAQQIGLNEKTSSWRQTARHFYTDSERIAVGDFKGTLKNLCADIPDKPDPARFELKRRTPLTSQGGLSATKGLDNSSGFIPPISHATFAVPAIMLPHATLRRRNNSLTLAAAFKHYYPDINYTPGQILLSNGTGLTSPPFALTIDVPVRSTPFYGTPLDSFVKDNAFHPTLANDSANLSLPISTTESIDLALEPKLSRLVGQTNSAIPSFSSKPYTALFIKGRGCMAGEILQPSCTT